MKKGSRWCSSAAKILEICTFHENSYTPKYCARPLFRRCLLIYRGLQFWSFVLYRNRHTWFGLDWTRRNFFLTFSPNNFQIYFFSHTNFWKKAKSRVFWCPSWLFSIDVNERKIQLDLSFKKICICLRFHNEQVELWAFPWKIWGKPI